MRLLLTLLAVLATPALAQESAVLGGWSLPEGASVHSETVTAFQGRTAGRGAMTLQSQSTDISTTVMDSVPDGRLARAIQTLEREENRSKLDGRLVPRDSDPLLGLAVLMEREEDGWVQRPMGWRPTQAQRTELDEPFTLDDAEYPTHPLTIGETYEVPDDTIPLVYLGATDAPRRLTVRLDSLGTVDGAPVAYLTQDVLVTVGTGSDAMTMDMTARIVRRLDWMLDVETHWRGEVSFGGPGALSGVMDYRATQTVTFPD